MAKDAGITKTAAGAALGSFIEGVTKALKKKDGKVALVGFKTPLIQYKYRYRYFGAPNKTIDFCSIY